jgi:hypothetical protein
LFFKNRQREDRTSSLWRVGTRGRVEGIKEEYRRVKILCIMYVNGKMRLVETIPEMRGRGIKENDRWGEFNYDIVRTFVNVIMYPKHNNNFF